MGRTSDANERLMQAALDLMWEESYGAITIDDICKRAGVKKGSFYYFFDSKSDLAIAALEWMWINDWKPKLDATFSPSVEPLKRISNQLEAVYASQLELKKRLGKVLGCPIFSVGCEISTSEDLLCAKVREITGRKRRYYESAIRDAVAEGALEACDPAQKANCLLGLIEGTISQARLMNDLELIRPLAQNGLDLLRSKASAAA